MTKFFAAASIILTLTVISFSQAKSGETIIGQLKALRADKTFEVIYDKSADNSKIIGFSDDFSKTENRRNDVRSFRFGLALNFQGNVITTAPDVFLLTFQAGTKKDKFRNSRGLKLKIDDEVLDLGEARYGNKNEGVEYLNFVLNRKQSAKIAAGRNVRVNIGDAEFNLRPEQIKMFANLLLVSDPKSL